MPSVTRLLWIGSRRHRVTWWPMLRWCVWPHTRRRAKTGRISYCRMHKRWWTRSRLSLASRRLWCWPSCRARSPQSGSSLPMPRSSCSCPARGSGRRSQTSSWARRVPTAACPSPSRSRTRRGSLRSSTQASTSRVHSRKACSWDTVGTRPRVSHPLSLSGSASATHRSASPASRRLAMDRASKSHCRPPTSARTMAPRCLRSTSATRA
mmetsp:Transcript_74673/g.242656  ORF Transcript_74673/g.242656 Transcript_74673/m.242656 type:complete len:209 (+) Transcript_74673:1836-2462(+)